MNGKIAVQTPHAISRSILILYWLSFTTDYMLSAIKKYSYFLSGNRFYSRVVHTEAWISHRQLLNQRLNNINRLLTYIIVPLIGLLIPSFTRLFPAQASGAVLFFHIAFYIALALIIYKGNMFFLRRIRMELRDSIMPYHQLIGLHFLVNIVYSSIIALAFLSTWNSFVNQAPPFDKPVIIATLVILICVLFINNVYEILFLHAENKIAGDRMQELELAKTKAELQALNSQVDPHFMYNALNTLSYLLQQHPEKADQYNGMLSSIYKYVLQKNGCDIVPIQEELQFCRHYFAIQQLRFGAAAHLNIQLDANENIAALQVPPLAVQTLIENAFKHNIFSELKPLYIDIVVEDGIVRVSNNLCAKYNRLKDGGTGLSNLSKRLLLVAQQALHVNRSANNFVVTFAGVCKSER